MPYLDRWSGISLMALSAALVAGTTGAAAAAELCVNPQGSNGCYSSINAAIAAAAPGDTIRVGQGTYKEHLVINKPLSLIGFNAANTMIDASGPGNGTGIYVDGMDNLTAADTVERRATARDARLDLLL